MTSRTFQQSILAEFAARQCGRSDRRKSLSLDELRAVCFCMRERIRAGWCDADWIQAIEAAPADAAHLPDRSYRLDPNDRGLQGLLLEIEDIFHGRELPGDGYAGMETAITEHGCKYWCWLDRPRSGEFTSLIMEDHANHPNMLQMGTMMFFG